ncbi:MAG TPA: hypothetical protein GX731_10430 [Clostridiales bacterium]|nr:hypothetical protein [Clostridiales bacterium]
MGKTIEIECKSCSGTGLYKGSTERDGCATVCTTCEGTGKVDFTYKEFEDRKLRIDVKRVFGNTCGYIHSDQDVTTKEGKLIRFSNGGCTYEEWLSGANPKPVKELYCPYIWNNKGIGDEPLQECKEYCGFGSISNCKIYDRKHECWKKLESIE